jgi:cytochrome oxidase Cu insertion factor (SCO1/SenC/PrrC family)
MGTLAEGHKARYAGSRFPVRAGALVLAGAALLGGTIGVGLHVWLGTRHASAVPALEGQAVWRAGQVAAPDFTLRDQRGQLVSLGSQRGRTVVLAFMDSKCHQVCPGEGRILAEAIAGVPRSARPTLLVVSVDPWADTSASARAAAKAWHIAGSWHWLLGTQRQLGKVWRPYRIYVKRAKGDIVHSDAVYVIDRQGFERIGFLYPFLPGPVERDLVSLAHGGGT